MSKEIKVSFEIHNRAILKKALSQLGYVFTETGDEIAVSGDFYMPVRFNIAHKDVSFDNMDTKKVNAIKQAYSVGYYRDQAIREGSQVAQEVMSDGSIRLRIQ